MHNTISGFVAQENTVEDGGVIRVADVDEKSKSTQLTVHVGNFEHRESFQYTVLT